MESSVCSLPKILGHLGSDPAAELGKEIHDPIPPQKMCKGEECEYLEDHPS